MARRVADAPVIVGEPNGQPISGTGKPEDAAPGAPGHTILADGTVIVDPAAIGGAAGTDDNGASSQPRRRGRKPGSTNRPRAEKGPAIDITGLEFILLNAHEMLAGITKTSELELEKEEAEKLAQSIANVGRHYNMAMSAKMVDWTALMMVLGSVYGTRFTAIRMRRIMERGSAAKPTQAQPAQRPAPAPPKAANGSAAPSGVIRTIQVPGVGPVEVPDPGNG